MSILDGFIIFAIGSLAGLAGGFFGIGGGTIVVPLLMMLIGLPIASATGNSLASMLLPVSIFGVIKYWKEDLVNWQCGLAIALGLFIGSFPGAFVVVKIPEKIFTLMYSGFLIYAGSKHIFMKPQISNGIDKIEKIDKYNTTNTGKWRNLIYFLFPGLFAGIFAGMFGVGGGAIIVPILTLVYKMDYRVAVATSLFALLWPVGFLGDIVYYVNGNISLLVTGLLASGMFVFAGIGAIFSLKLPKSIVKKAFGVFLILIALKYIIQIIISFVK